MQADGQWHAGRRVNIDLGLEILALLQPSGLRLTCQDIADVCGCSHQRIRQIELRALAKLRRRALERRKSGDLPSA